MAALATPSAMNMWLAGLQGATQEWREDTLVKLTNAGITRPREIVGIYNTEHLEQFGFSTADAEYLTGKADEDFFRTYQLSPVVNEKIEFTLEEGSMKVHFKGLVGDEEDSPDVIVVAAFDTEGGPGPAEQSGLIEPLDVLIAANDEDVTQMEFQDVMKKIQDMPFPKKITFQRRNLDEGAVQLQQQLANGQFGAPSESNAPTQMEGWLNKQGHFNTNWKRRYFKLFPGQIRYYNGDPSAGGSELGRIELKNCTLYSTKDGPHAFVIQTIDEKGNKKAYPLRAENDASRECWIELARFHGSDALMTGWLTKQGEINTLSNKRRWFVLEPPTNLHYFTAPAGEWKGTIDVKDATIREVNGNGMTIRAKKPDGSTRDYKLRAENPDELNAWKQQVEEVSGNASADGGNTVEADVGDDGPDDEVAAEQNSARPKSTSRSGGSILGNMFRSTSTRKTAGANEKGFDVNISLDDFTLMKVVGKGAFGKVMMARKKTGDDAGQIYAIKILVKSVIAVKKQVEHTKSERRILREVQHPFIVCLRYAFQSPDKLYLVTDYYNGGSLFYHLRKAKNFPVERARFYAAELMLAIDHLHKHGIIYRDLKLENILMDHEGHIALTDFGLSKESVESVFADQLRTFCGTAEYIAPELLKGMKYGAAVDWWSFGILLYEMLDFKTPFYDKNRKLMFHSIINQQPRFKPHFTQEAEGIIRIFLEKDPRQRLGCGDDGADRIKGHPFFTPHIDWERLMNRDMVPPFHPDVSGESDTKYVPSVYLKLDAKDSMAKPSPGSSADGNWDNFTFVSGNVDEANFDPMADPNAAAK